MVICILVGTEWEINIKPEHTRFVINRLITFYSLSGLLSSPRSATAAASEGSLEY